MINCYSPAVARASNKARRPPLRETPTVIDEDERAALQELADRHGIRWRTVLLAAHDKGTLVGVLRGLMSQPDAGNKIARAVIIPRSLPPVALYYGPLHFC
jgi:hypothetical protein